jgi:hypothetical protein
MEDRAEIQRGLHSVFTLDEKGSYWRLCTIINIKVMEDFGRQSLYP